MQVISYTKARNELATMMNKVCEDHVPIVISRQEQRPVVLLSLEDFNSIEETLYLLSSPKNASRVIEAAQDFKENKNFISTEII